VTGVDEDVLLFTPTSLGDTTSGTWSWYFDGSDVGLATDSNEDVDAIAVATDGSVLLSTLGAFAVTGVSGTGSDVFSCVPATLGATTACTFNTTLFFQGSSAGIGTNNVDGFEVHGS
jgi:hypothetical protein